MPMLPALRALITASGAKGLSNLKLGKLGHVNHRIIPHPELEGTPTRVDSTTLDGVTSFTQFGIICDKT